MQKLKGFIQIELIKYAVIGLAVIAAVTALILAGKSFIDGIDNKGYDRGVNETSNSYIKRDNQALKDALAEVQRLQEQAAILEETNRKSLAKIEVQRKKEKQNAANQDAEDDITVATGLRLRDKTGNSNCSPNSNTGSESQTATAAAKRDGEKGANLSAEASRFLLRLANEADDTVRQLTSSQQTIEEYLKACQ